MYNPTLRLLAMLELLQSRGEVSASELAQTLEIDERSVRRYVMMLRDIGVPVEGERGRHGGYSLGKGFRLPPLMLNNDEAVAVMMGLMLMHELGAPSPLAVESAAAKIERVLPEPLRATTDALRQSLVLDHFQPGSYPATGDQIIAFTLAAHEGRCLRIVYAAAEGDVSERVIAPYGLVHHARAWYVPAYCHLREGMRVFRLDRVRDYARTTTTFTRPDDFDPQAFVLDTLARIPGTHAFEVVIHAPLATAREVVPPDLAVLASAGDDTLMRCYSDDPFWLARNLIWLELPFTVREDDALRDAIRTLADDLRASIRP